MLSKKNILKIPQVPSSESVRPHACVCVVCVICWKLVWTCVHACARALCVRSCIACSVFAGRTCNCARVPCVCAISPSYIALRAPPAHGHSCIWRKSKSDRESLFISEPSSSVCSSWYFYLQFHFQIFQYV